MSHVVLARKYRPRSFEQMVGQAHVVQALTNALSSGRLHHAYLFTGTRGIGKTTVSRILAKSLNCTGADGAGGVTAHPCGVCQACTEIDADRFIDYIELDAASNRSIDEIRELIERAAYKPSVGRYKVFMIDEAHQLTKDAFNALLKTLEEPPDYLKFVLATTDPEKMLPTVLSRCLQFNLRPMAPEVVHEHLAQVLATEGVAAEAGALRLLARAARGSMRDALSLTDQAIAYGAGTLREDGVRAMLGTVDRSHAASLVQALAGHDGAGVLATVAALRQLGLSGAGTLEEMAALLQQMAIEQAVPGALDDTDPDTAGARALAAALAPDETQLLYGIVVHGRAELSLLSDEYAALTMVLLRLLAFPPAGAAPLAAVAPRAAPLVAAPREARSTAPARPPVPLRPSAGPATAAAPAAPVRSAAPAAVPMAALAAGVPTAQEPPPWLDEELPAEDSPADSGRSASPDDARTDGEPPARRTVPVTPPVPALQATALGDQWAATVRPLLAAGSVTALVRELALQAELLAVAPRAEGGRRWRLRVERETLRNPALAAKLGVALQDALGEATEVDVEAGVALDSIARRDGAAREAAQQQAEQLIRSDPVVLALMAQFDTARIVPGSIKPLAATSGDTKAPPP
ncbi:MAG: DNA polymerase III subunit gamma/tau [Burkholderiaceae bacterium]|nr:DNA polymerase III subunit gamma/tau [Burkholderiaceae bacterium]